MTPPDSRCLWRGGRTSRRRIFGAILGAQLLFALAMPGPPLRAAPADQVAASWAHFEKGQRLFDVGAYAQALEEFRAAYVAKPDPAYIWNLAQCHRLLGMLPEAIVLYRRYVTHAPRGQARAQAEKHIEELEARTKVALAPAPPPPASAAVPAAPPPAQSPLALARSRGEPDGAEAPRTERARWLPWVTGAAAVGLAGGAVVAGVSERSQFDHLKQTCGRTVRGCPDSDVSSARSRALLANLLWGGAAVAAVATGIALYVGRDQGGVSVAGRF